MTNQKHRFQVIVEKFGAYPAYKLLDSETGEYAFILPYLGGTINNLTLKNNDKLIDIVEGYKSAEEAAKTQATSFKGSNLFPYPNRIRDGKYSHLGQQYQFNIDFAEENTSIHGLVYDKEFELISKENGDVHCSLVILYSPKELPAAYPFKYTLEVEYRWIKYALFECTSKVTNHSETDIPVGIGWHPYMVAGSDKVDDLWVQFPSQQIIEVDKRNIPTGSSKNFTEFNQLTQLGATAFDNCFVLNTETSPAEIVLFNKKTNFGYKIWQETGDRKYNYLQVYTPPTRRSIAFEPMTCIPDAFNNKKGLISLPPGKSVSVKWGISPLN